MTGPLGTHDLSWTSPTSPGVGGGLDAMSPISPTTQPSIPLTSLTNNTTAAWMRISAPKIRATFAIYWVPVDQTHYNGPVRPYNLYHHSAINDAFSGIWNHTFSPSFLNEARANAAGWRWNEIASNPQEPFGLPSDSVGTIGTITLQNFGAPGPSVYNQWTYSYRDVATKIAGNHSIKFGGELTRLYYLNEAAVQCAAEFQFLQRLGFPERCAAVGVGHLRSHHRHSHRGTPGQPRKSVGRFRPG